MQQHLHKYAFYLFFTLAFTLTYTYITHMPKKRKTGKHVGEVRIIDKEVLAIVRREASRTETNPTKTAQRMIVEHSQRKSVLQELAAAGVVMGNTVAKPNQ